MGAVARSAFARSGPARIRGADGLPIRPMIVVPEDTSDAVRRRLRALEEQGCTAIVVTAIGKTGIAYYSGSLKLPDGSAVRASRLTANRAGSTLADETEVRLRGYAGE